VLAFAGRQPGALLQAPAGRGDPGGGRQAAVGLLGATEVSKRPGQGLWGTVAGRTIQVTSRRKLAAQRPDLEEALPARVGGLECMVVVDSTYGGTLRFRDQPRTDGASFLRYLDPRHLNRSHAPPGRSTH